MYFKIHHHCFYSKNKCYTRLKKEAFLGYILLYLWSLQNYI